MDWHTPESIGHRALARGLSDLAAMGARPVAVFLSLGLPRALTKTSKREQAWIDRFYDGLLSLASAHNTPLAGGDLAESSHRGRGYCSGRSGATRKSSSARRRTA